MRESGEIMWVHWDIVQDERWETSKHKLKGKSRNIVSLLTDDDSVTVTSLSDTEGEKPALAAQPSTSQPVGTRSGKQYLWQYDQTPDGASQPMTSGTAAPVQAPAPKVKKSRRRFALMNLWRRILPETQYSLLLWHICWPKVTITRFWSFDDNKTYIVICTNHILVFKCVLGF